MSTKKKLLLSAAGVGGGTTTDVDDVFATNLWVGNSGSQNIDNGIALTDGIGGGTSTEFNASDYLSKSFSSNGLASSSKTFTFSAWIYWTGSKSQGIFSHPTFSIATIAPANVLTVSGFSDSYGTILGYSTTNAINKNQWLHLLVSIDMSDASKRHVYLNDASLAGSFSTYTNTNIGFGVAGASYISSNSATWEGKLAHIYFDTTYRDFSVTSNRRTFIAADGGSTSYSTLSALNPPIYFPMTTEYAVGKNLGTVGDYTVNGSPTIVTSGTEIQSNYGQGGLVWTKQRTSGSNEHHWLSDTERTAQHTLSTNLDSGQIGQVNNAPTLNSSGYQLHNWIYNNDNNEDYVGWTFRKAPKFFDIVTWTGNGTENRQISHNLGSVPGMILVKGYSLTEDWNIYHRSTGTSKYIQLNGTANAANVDTGAGGANLWFGTTPTSTHFTVDEHARVNGNGNQYIAYIFAHNNGDGEFGPDADQDIIKCGTYTGNNSTNGPTVNLGFEPQWLFIRHIDANGNSSFILDNMRGLYTDRADPTLSPNANNDEQASQDMVDLTSTGFQLKRANDNINGNGNNYIYVAIRRGPLATPTNANDVFGTSTRLAGTLNVRAVAGFPVDGYLRRNDINSSDSFQFGARLTGGAILTYDNSAEFDLSGSKWYEHQDGLFNGTGSGAAEDTDLYLMWKRAPGYFDQVCYDGNGSARTITHNLGVVPEMMWVKMRTGGSGRWVVYHKDLGNTKYAFLNEADAFGTFNAWNNTTPTSSVFSLSSWGDVNQSSQTFVAHLFATADGVSKVGSYTGNGSTSGPTVDCGFSGSPRFILIKKATGGTGSWAVFDHVRGIVAGNESQIYLNNNAAQQSATDQIDPTASGFQVVINSATLNSNGETYIFYAVA